MEKELREAPFCGSLEKQKAKASAMVSIESGKKKIRKEELVGECSECWLPSSGPLNPVTMETPEGSRNDSRNLLMEPLKWKQHRSTKANFVCSP